MSETDHPHLILGLFDQERDADAALSQLASSGLGRDAIKVLDKPDLHRADPDVPLPAFKAGASLGPLRPQPEATPGTDVTEGTVQDQRSHLQQLLERMALAQDEAHYYADGVYEGGTLVLVQVTGQEEAQQIRALLADAGASNFNH